jgi:hypothetical protein
MCRIRVRSSCFPPNVENVESIRRVLALQRVARLAHEMRNIDDGKWIGALDDEKVSGRELTQRFAGPQRRQRALQSTQIERGRSQFGCHVCNLL